MCRKRKPPMNYIYTNGEYVVLLGAKLYIFKTDGRLVACRSDLRYAGRITFLSDNRMLLCSSKAVFHMVNLCDGCDIWTAPYTKCELNVSDIALSPNELFAYTYDEWKGCHFISRLDLQTTMWRFTRCIWTEAPQWTSFVMKMVFRAY